MTKEKPVFGDLSFADPVDGRLTLRQKAGHQNAIAANWYGFATEREHDAKVAAKRISCVRTVANI